jgi:tripartite-type tricarboxylate transporter receptor subunit TctC
MRMGFNLHRLDLSAPFGAYRITLAALAFMTAATNTGTAAADDAYPSKPIRLIVGFGAGGPTDIPARYIADKLGTALGKRVVVENKSAAAGMIATRDLLAQPRDGYTLLLCTHFDPINVATHRNAGFKLSDLAPISLIAKYYYGLALTNAIPADSFDSFVAYVKAHPGEVTYATIGAGSAQEVTARQLGKLAGITMNRIPFRGGPEVVQEMVAGRVDFYAAPTLAIVPQYQARQIKILATTSPERLANLPEVPTVREKGINFVRFGWLGICGAAGTPASIVHTLHDKIVPIVATPEYQRLVENAGSIAVSSTPEELSAVMKDTSDDVTSSVREFGMQQDND